jgi:hypothetical protein
MKIFSSLDKRDLESQFLAHIISQCCHIIWLIAESTSSHMLALEASSRTGFE